MKLAPEQGGTISELERRGCQVVFLGIDELNNPVVLIRDSRRTFPMAVKPDGSGDDPIGHLRQHTDTEMQEMETWESELLFGLPASLKPTKE